MPILVLKALRRKYESVWRNTRLTVHFDMHSESCMAVKKAISKSTSVILQKKISDCNGDQKKLFKMVVKKCQDTSLSEVLCKLIIIVLILFV